MNWPNLADGAVLTVAAVYVGGLITTLIQNRHQKPKQQAEVKTLEATADAQTIDDVIKAVQVWKALADKFAARLGKLEQSSEASRKAAEKAQRELLRQLSEIKREMVSLANTVERFLKKSADEQELSDALHRARKASNGKE